MELSDLQRITSADLRAMIERHWIGPLYRLAAASDLHPAHLSAILHERAPLKACVALDIIRAIERQRGPHGR